MCDIFTSYESKTYLSAEKIKALDLKQEIFPEGGIFLQSNAFSASIGISEQLWAM